MIYLLKIKFIQPFKVIDEKVPTDKVCKKKFKEL